MHKMGFNDPAYSLDQRFEDQGVWVDPVLPEGFLERPMGERSRLEMGIWWCQPFVQSLTNEEDGSTVYSVFILDGETIDAVSPCGTFDVYEDAIAEGVRHLRSSVAMS
jgi:hypothetical protein